MDSLVRSGADQPKIGTTVDLLAYTPCKAEPQAEGETSAGLMICTRLTDRHEVLFGRQRRFDGHEPRYFVLTENMERGFDRGAGVFGRRGRGKHETALQVGSDARFAWGYAAETSACICTAGSASSWPPTASRSVLLS